MTKAQRRSEEFEETPDRLAGSGTAENLKFEREDWSLFRTVEGLQQKAGVAKDKLTRLVIKELADNGLDSGAAVRVGTLAKGGYFVEDNGAGIDGTAEEIARLFSIARPMVSTKLLRLPTRGALGNGLRVVAGAVLASKGFLIVITRNRRIELRPERDGTTTVVEAKPIDFPIGTRIEIGFGPALPCDNHTLYWAGVACQLGTENAYAGKASPWWYDDSQFHELLYASGATPVRELIIRLDGCSGAKAGEIVAVARLGRALCTDITHDQARRLLLTARQNAREVKAERLGPLGPEKFIGHAYARAYGSVTHGSPDLPARVPYIVEAWVHTATEGGETSAVVCVNRTPVTGNVSAARDKRDIDLFGCGLHHTIAQAPKDTEFVIWLNITTPFMPITSDGKAPNLQLFFAGISEAAAKAVRKARRPSSGKKLTQKDIVLDNLDVAIAKVSGDGALRFNQRQVLYALRPIVMDEIGETLTTANFTGIITDYESEHGEIPLMYREPRGTLYHPHRSETITLGTLMVEDYERPAWTFNKLVYIEKEGFSEALKAVRWPERHDCALMSSKGFTTRAARDLVDKLAMHDEPVTIFCVHDADASGSMIYQTFQQETKARGARKVRIVNLGLEPWEAIAMGLDTEDVEEKQRAKPVADYIRDRDDADWSAWLQAHRIELNAMTTPQFVAWLDRKMAEHGKGKLIPPPDVLAADLRRRLEDKVRAAVSARILREAGFEDQVTAAIAAIKTPTGAVLAKGIEQLFERKPDREWRDYVEAVAVKRLPD